MKERDLLLRLIFNIDIYFKKYIYYYFKNYIIILQLLGVSSIVIPLLVYWKRHKWTTVKNTKILFTPRHKPPQ